MQTSILSLSCQGVPMANTLKDPLVCQACFASKILICGLKFSASRVTEVQENREKKS